MRLPALTHLLPGETGTSDQDPAVPLNHRPMPGTLHSRTPSKLAMAYRRTSSRRRLRNWTLHQQRPLLSLSRRYHPQMMIPSLSRPSSTTAFLRSHHFLPDPRVSGGVCRYHHVSALSHGASVSRRSFLHMESLNRIGDSSSTS